MLGVVKVVPVPKLVPPVAAEYQLMVPADAVAPSVTVPVPQRLSGVVPVIVGMGFTITEILLVAGPPMAQGAALEVSITEITLSLVSAVVVNVLSALFGPVFSALICH
jgi:hypothetical protein